MRLTSNGFELIKRFEGCRLSTYRDSAGVLTIGYGHTKNVIAGQSITQSQANRFLWSDVETAEKAVNKYSKYNFTQNQFDALVSFAYNIGSINQLTANGTRSISEISAKIPLYCNAGGRKLDGLVNRRNAEKKLFDTCLVNSEKINNSDIKYYKIPEVKSNSISNALTYAGVNSSFSNRKNIASKNGMPNYTGKASENIQLLNLLYAGKLKK